MILDYLMAFLSNSILTDLLAIENQ